MLVWHRSGHRHRNCLTKHANFLMSGERRPYKEGPLGMIKPGAYADILLADGNPLEDPKLLGSNGKYLALIRKDRVIYKSTLN